MTETTEQYKINATAELMAKLCAPFPKEAYEVDESREFTLVGIGGMWMIERLNQVFGLCGTGWRYTMADAPCTEKEISLYVTLQYNIGGAWSEPITVVGNNGIVYGHLGDARKGALTDGIKKAASILGVGIEAYKGQIAAPPRRFAADKKPSGEKQAEGTFTYEGFVADAENFKRAGGVVFSVGKHKEESVGDVDKADRGYISWLSEQPKPDTDSPMLAAWAACRYYRAYRKTQEPR